MKPFKGIADDNSEQALRRGYVVPEGAVNLAWAKAPKISPKNNVVVIDTSRIVSETQTYASKKKRLAYANAVGILEDENGNQVWNEEYPVISDLFGVESNFSEEYAYPYVHVSRFFHLDAGGMGLPGQLFEYSFKDIKLIDKNGNEYLDSNGKRKYKIFLYCAPTTADSLTDTDTAYRAFVFYDCNLEEELFFIYNKVEINASKKIVNHELSYKETANPRPYYNYVPEESDVIDHSSYLEKVYSTKPITLKQKVVGLPVVHTEGWKIYVPRKAINDTRIFQLFRWRVVCEFIKNVEIDPVRSDESIKCGVVVTGSNDFKCGSPYTFSNLAKTQYNFTKAKMVNPLKSDHSTASQSAATYWHVDFDTVTQDELAKFDVLVWAPDTPSFDVAAANRNYLTKVNYFVESVGGTMIFDTNNSGIIKGLGITTTAPVNSGTGKPSGPDFTNQDASQAYYSNTQLYVTGSTITAPDTDDELISGNTAYGGIDIDDDALDTISPYKYSSTHNLSGFRYCQYITNAPSDFRTVLHGTSNTAGTKPTVIAKTFSSGGNMVYSTMGITAAVNAVFDPVTGTLIDDNRNTSTVAASSGLGLDNYSSALSSLFMNGCMKFMLNNVYKSTKMKPIDRADKSEFSTSFAAYSDWKASWVINAGNGVLSDEEKKKYNFILSNINQESTEPIWQRNLSTQTFDQIVDAKLTAEQKLRVAGATRRYSIQVTNSKVITPDSSLITGSSTPRAWTTAYSPKLVIPADFGPYVVKEEEFKAEYEPGTYTYKSYPPKPYTAQLGATYVTTSQGSTTLTATIEMDWTATSTTTIEKQLITPGVASSIVDVDLHWTTHGLQGSTFYPSTFQWQSGAPHPGGIDSLHEFNYYSTASGSVNLNWPYWGPHETLSVANKSTGTWVKFVQDAMNRFYFLRSATGFIPSSNNGLEVDGIYGPSTAKTVLDFQTYVGARWKDGVVDAETWSLIGWMIIKLRNDVGYDAAPSHLGDFYTYYDWPMKFMQMHHFADGDQTTAFCKRSWTSDSATTKAPTRIADVFEIKLAQQHKVVGVTMIPYLHDSQVRTERLDWLNVGAGPANLGNFNNYSEADYSVQFTTPGTLVARTLEADVPSYIPIFPVNASAVMFAISQDQPAGFGAARVIGMREVIVHAQITGAAGSLPVYSEGGTKQETVSGSFSQTVTINTGQKVEIVPSWSYNGEGTLSNFKWSSFTLSNSNVIVDFVSANQTITNIQSNPTWYTGVTDWTGAKFVLTHNAVVNDVSGNQYTYGPKFGYNGSAEYRTRTPEGMVEPYSRTDGLISKQDGLRLICTPEGKPFGFPDTMPTQWTNGNTMNAHFTKISLNSAGTDSFVYIGLWDNKTKEFITSPAGHNEISYYEYVTRGPENIFVGVICKYEIESTQALPEATDAPMLPYRWVMPVYCVSTGERSRIQIEPLPSDLNITDIWAVPIRTGSYSRPVKIRSKSEGGITNFAKDYQGETLTAYYNVVEANSGLWSDIYGRPYIDVRDEVPMILDDNVIKLRQAPILMIQEPTGSVFTAADPWRPVITVQKRQTINNEWETLSMADIKDFHAHSGLITLEEDLYSNDPRLVRVTYTTVRSTYQFKTDGVNRINLNPYINDKPEWLNTPLYIYILPEFCTTSDGVVIADSVRTRTIYLAETNSIFDPLQSDYDPLAVMLGVIYITNSFNTGDLVLLDTRRRGGGLSVGIDDEEVVRIVQEASHYWDVNYNHASSYQKGGFVIIRLPAELRNDLNEKEIRAAIERNITAGVRYQIEDLEGNAWDGEV